MATRALRGSPHVLNALLLTAALVPVSVFAMTRGPTPEALEETLVRRGWLIRWRSMGDVLMGDGTHALASSSHLPALLLIPPQREEFPLQSGRAERMNAFWSKTRATPEMERVYADLLRNGSGAKKRHYELTGKHAEAEAAAQRRPREW